MIQEMCHRCFYPEEIDCPYCAVHGFKLQRLPVPLDGYSVENGEILCWVCPLSWRVADLLQAQGSA